VNNTEDIENLETKVKDPFKKAVVDLWNGANCESKFKYHNQQENHLFDWGDFSRSCSNPDAMSRRLEELVEHRRIGH